MGIERRELGRLPRGVGIERREQGRVLKGVGIERRKRVGHWKLWK